MPKKTPDEYEQCHDAFFKQMKAFTDAGTITNAKIETAWQLKRIADYLECIAIDGVLSWTGGPP